MWFPARLRPQCPRPLCSAGRHPPVGRKTALGDLIAAIRSCFACARIDGYHAIESYAGTEGGQRSAPSSVAAFPKAAASASEVLRWWVGYVTQGQSVLIHLEPRAGSLVVSGRLSRGCLAACQQM
jgi:hypothetical protein